MTTTYFEKPEKICAEKSFTEVRYRPKAAVRAHDQITSKTLARHMNV